MTEAQAVEAMARTFTIGWAAAQPSVPIALDNEAMDTAPTWAQFTIVHTVRAQISMGGTGARRFQSSGNIAVSLYVPLDQGRAAFSALADAVRAILESRPLTIAGADTPVTTYAGATRNERVEGAWYAGAVVFAFDYYALG